MTPDERNLITGLFQRLRQADGATGQKDAEALQLIQQQTTAVPTAPYLLVQTVLVQEHALTNAQTRIAELERQVANARQTGQGRQPQEEEGGSFLGNLLKKATGAVSPQPPPLPASAQARGPGAAYGRPNPGQPGGGGGYDPNAGQPGAAPYPTTNTMSPGGGGSFLRTALGTAAGVAGGAMLFQGISGLMGQNAGPFAGGLSGLTGGGGASGTAAAGGGAETTNAAFGDAGGAGGGTVGDFADQFGGGGGGGGGQTVGDYADAQGGGGGGFFDSGPEVRDAGFDEGGGGGTVGDYMDSGGDGDDGGGFFDGGDDGMV